MKVGVYYNNKDVRVEERHVPEIMNNEILLKVMASGICGSDLMEFHRIKKAPCVLGHEVAGIIEEAGENIPEYMPGKKLKQGDRIFVTHHVPCDSCRECQRGYKTRCDEFIKINNFYPGGFSQYIRVGGRSLKTGVIKLPDEISYEQASFIEPLGTAVEIAEQLHGDTILVLGTGVAGILNIQLSKAYGVGNIIATDTNKERLEFARKFGADHTINSKEYSPKLLREVNEGRLADRVIICTGASSTTEQAFQSYEPGGKIIFFATPPEKEKIETEWYSHWRSLREIKMTYGATPLSNKTAFWLIKHKVINVDEMITHKLPLEKIADGFRLASEGKGLKFIIKPNG